LAEQSETPALPAIPTNSIEDALRHLRRPFTPGALKWKIQASDFYDGKKGGSKKDATWVLVVPYIDARLVSARLNAVVAGGWSEEAVEKVGEHLLRYRLTVLGQSHTDVGEGQGRGAGMKVKATDSDALKRVAVRFGIAEYLYAMPGFNFFVTPSAEVKDDKPTVYRQKSGKPGYLKDTHEEWLRNAYKEWLEQEGEKQFGPVLDHGDTAAGSVGVLIESEIPEIEVSDEDLRPSPLEDDQAKRLRERIQTAFTNLCEVNPDRLTEGRADKMVEEAAHSHAELERVAETIERLRDTEAMLGDKRHKLTELLGKTKAKPIIDSAERRGSQEERIAAMDKAIADAENAE
jgi:hypothetical protein